MSAAYHIAKRGVRVVLLEKGLVGSNASGVNFGGVRTNGRSEGEMSLSMRAAGRAHVLPESIFTGTHVANHFIPALRGLNIIRTWSGIDGLMPDEMPVMGCSEKVPGLVHGFGFSGHGFQFGPASGAVLCELALDGTTATQIEAFKPGRFASRAEADRKQ